MQFNTKSVKLGASIAASWAWGTSLIVGMEVAQQKGLMAWTIWAIANALTLAVFGALTKAGILGRAVFNKPYIKGIAIVIQIFCLIIQLNIINKVMMQLGAGELVSYLTATAIGIIFTLLMYKRGLTTSILTDRYQWFAAMAAIVAIIAIGLFSGVDHWTYPASTSSDVLWGVWSACVLLSGPIGDVQHWQRADIAGKSNAFMWGAAFFAIYMLMVLAMSYFKFNAIMNIILLVAVLNVTSSTIDSIVVAMHEISNKKTGTLLALFICIFWGVFAKIGIIELWSYAGIYRVAFAILIICLGIQYTRKYGAQKTKDCLLYKTVK